MTGISLTAAQEQIVQSMEDSLDHFFVTGRAGTGKTTVLQAFVDQTAKRVAVAAPTGVAALAVGGQTLHSLLRLPLGIIGGRELGFIPKESLELLSHLDALVIDEVSMVSADLVDAIDRRLRQAKRRKHVAFGGVQLIMFGDPYQLAPVVSGAAEKAFYRDHYSSPWFFDAAVWRDADMSIHELEDIHRQADQEFRSVLNALREGRMEPEMGRMLNERGARVPEDPQLITLTTTNAQVTSINRQALDRLPGSAKIAHAEVEGDFGSSTSYPADEELVLKPGAKVMFLRNDLQGTEGPRYVNGTLGTVKKITSTVVVEVDGEDIDVEPVTWEKVRYEYQADTKTISHDVVAEFTQFPLRLAWAVTIHKAQGKTLDAAVIDLGPRAFAPGQTYVAFSRLTSLEGLYLKRPLSPSDIIVDEDVVRFMSQPRVHDRLL